MRQSFYVVRMQTSPYLWDTIIDGLSEVRAGVSQGPNASVSVIGGKNRTYGQTSSEIFLVCYKDIVMTIVLHKEKFIS